MKKIAIIILIIIVVLAGIWFWIGLKAKAKYDKARNRLIAERPKPYSVVPFTDTTTALLEKAQGEWIERYTEINGPNTMALETLKLKPTVKNLVYVLTYQMPEYSWLSSSQNEIATKTALVHLIKYVQPGVGLFTVQLRHPLVAEVVFPCGGLAEHGLQKTDHIFWFMLPPVGRKWITRCGSMLCIIVF